MKRRVALLSISALAGCGRVDFDARGPYGGGSIDQVRLVQAHDPNRTTIADLDDGVAVDVTDYIPAPGFAVEVVYVTPPALAIFAVNGATQMEYQPPYVSAGDVGDPANDDRKLRVGNNDLSLEDRNADGVVTGTFGMSFTLEVPVAGPMSITGFALVDPKTGTMLAPLAEGAAIPIGTLATPSGVVDVEMATVPEKLGGVDVVVTGQIPGNRTENWPPYMSFGKDGFTPTIGSYTVNATPLDRADGTGTRGPSSTITFSITP